nr:PREDICTED: SH2 domain-containing protein 2A [Latimeria chalumnae]|eukprot:XP_014341391.1 PREDICTED: SH2 domain-containing protein 2A [Latimeria chalumnae]
MELGYKERKVGGSSQPLFQKPHSDGATDGHQHQEALDFEASMQSHSGQALHPRRAGEMLPEILNSQQRPQSQPGDQLPFRSAENLLNAMTSQKEKVLDAPVEGATAGNQLKPENAACFLREQATQWFQQTQTYHLLQNGQLPDWFHGFISRRETEEILKDMPLGCFLVRMSESSVRFVLSYRAKERYRHFMIDHLPNGQYAILGEAETHTSLRNLLEYYKVAPIEPYNEHLTTACNKVRLLF